MHLLYSDTYPVVYIMQYEANNLVLGCLGQLMPHVLYVRQTCNHLASSHYTC